MKRERLWGKEEIEKVRKEENERGEVENGTTTFNVGQQNFMTKSLMGEALN